MILLIEGRMRRKHGNPFEGWKAETLGVIRSPSRVYSSNLEGEVKFL